MDRGRLRATGLEAHIGAEEPRQRERLQKRRWQLPQVDADLRTCLCDQGGRWHGPALRMMAKPESARRLHGCPQFRVLRQHERRPVAALQPQTVPDHEGAGLRRGHLPRDQPEDRFAGRTLDLLTGDHAEHVHPGRDAVADRQHIMPAVVVPEKPILHGRDRGQHRCRIGRSRAPFFPDQAHDVRREADSWQRGGLHAQPGQRLPQLRSGEMREFECNAVASGGMSIGDTA